MSEEIFNEEKIFTQHDVENEQLKEENEKLRKEKNEKLRKEENEKIRTENQQLRKNDIVKDVEIKESIEKPKEIKCPEEDENMTDYDPNWFDKNSFKKTLAIIEAANLVTGIKQVNSSILTLKTWLIILKIIQLVKYLLMKV